MQEIFTDLLTWEHQAPILFLDFEIQMSVWPPISPGIQNGSGDGRCHLQFWENDFS